MKYLDVKEENLFLISTLDYTQEMAVNITNEDTNLIITGDSSSGKTETVINIISNCLSQGKRILILSKNSNTRNNIYKRLSYINNKILLLNDSNIDLDYFYSELLNAVSDLSKNTGKTTLSKIKVLSRDIDKKLEMLNSINELFYKIRPSGLNLLDMYKLTEKKITNSDTLNEYYKIYRIRKPFINYNYTDLKKSVDTLILKDNIDQYVKYRRFKNNKLFSKLIKNINKDSISLALSNITSLLDNSLSFELPLCNSKYTEDFTANFLIDNTIEDDYIKTLAELVNLKHNSYILNKNNMIKKWNPAYWLKYKSLLKCEEDKKITFNNMEREIIVEFNENLENINLYIKSFDFIKNIVNEDEYKNFVKILLKNEDIIEYMINLKNTLNIYDSFKDVTRYVADFTTIENELLSYCYNNLERKEDIKKLLSFIPSLYLIHSIEEIETSEHDILHYYKNFEIILKEIQLSIDTKISFVPTGIKYTWDNIVSDLLSLQSSNPSNIIEYLNNNTENMEICDFLNLFKDIIFDIYPCFILNYEYLDILLPDTKGLFDVIIIYDGTTIQVNDLKSDIYKDNTHILIGESINNPVGSLLNVYSKEYTLVKLNYNYKDLSHSFDKNIKFNSYLQKELYETFVGLGYKLRINVAMSGYILDIVIYDNNYIKTILVLECDDIIYNDAYNAREVDLFKRKYLENNSLNIIRVWTRDWWINKKGEIKKIQRILEELLL